jgi:hypothetical protein
MNHAYTFHQPKYGYPAYRYQPNPKPNYSPEVLAQMADDAAELERRAAWVEAYNTPPPRVDREEKQAQQRAAEAEAAAAWERECAALQAQLDAFNAAQTTPQAASPTEEPPHPLTLSASPLKALRTRRWQPRRRRAAKPLSTPFNTHLMNPCPKGTQHLARAASGVFVGPWGMMKTSFSLSSHCLFWSAFPHGQPFIVSTTVANRSPPTPCGLTMARV